jgi:carbohydrate binding protein with CBM4/9 domain
MLKILRTIAHHMSPRCTLIASLVAISVGSAPASEVRQAPNVINGTFEDKPTVGWGRGQYSEDREWWWNSLECLSVAEISSQDHHTGKSSLHIINLSARAPNVYGTTQQAVAIQPLERYRVSLWAKAIQLESRGGVSIVVDQSWKVRPIQLPRGTYGWTQFHGDFSLDENTAQVRILCEDLAEVWIDDIEIAPIETPLP